MTEQKAVSPASKDSTSSASPVARFSKGDISVAVFTDTRKTKAGKTFTVQNVSLRRSYKNGDGGYAHTQTLRPSDIKDAITALQQCSDHLADDVSASEPGDQ